MMHNAPWHDTGAAIADYKCFGKTPAGFERILPLNVIIGRNNTGKSALLDLIADLVNPPNAMTTVREGATIYLTHPVTKRELEAVVPAPGGEELIGKRLAWKIRSGTQQFHSVDSPTITLEEQHYWGAIAGRKTNPLQELRFARLNADRDIIPEEAGAPAIKSNGEGTTRTIHYFRSHHSVESRLVERDMLNDLNTIVSPEMTFQRIDTRQLGTGAWEVYLDEEHKGRIPLSKSGSGLKTIILVLAYLHLLPAKEKALPNRYLYAFEELENNLHPATQRRLLRYLKDQSVARGCTFFLTTHAPIEIDYFARDENAQVIHVTHDGTQATTTTVSGYLHGRGILDDLDVRASDLLQSNGVIWVEGPSDRLYLNRWIALATKGELREGAHYQILQYGGALLAHLSAEAPDEHRDAINILTLNRNAAVLMDSDKDDEHAQLKTRVQRMTHELAHVDAFSWVTAGRTIENYLPLDRLYGSEPGPYEDAIAHITAHNTLAPVRFPTDKVRLARHITPLLQSEHLATLDLATRIDELCNRIRRWNKIQ